MNFEEAKKLYDKYKKLEGNTFREPQGNQDIKLIEVRYALNIDTFPEPIVLPKGQDEPTEEQKQKSDIDVAFIIDKKGYITREFSNEFLNFELRE